jgi:hypothetical protein
MLFENKERTRLSPMRQGESEYAYYDACARPGYAAYRALINQWIERLPTGGRAEIVARFRRREMTSYRETLAELVVHEAIVSQGYAAELHPLGGHPTNRLDFRVSTADTNPFAFVEVTSMAPAASQIAQENRGARIYDAIDRIQMPAGWRLLYHVDRAALDSPAMGQVCQEVTEWVNVQAAGDPAAMPVKIFSPGDWRIELTLLGGFDPTSEDDRAISGALGQIRRLTPNTKIRQAVSGKGDKYGELDAPFLIVVADCKDELAGGEHNATALLEAMFGSERTRFRRQPNGEMLAREERAADGYWGINGAARHQNVSGVMIIPKPNLWHIRDDGSQPVIVRNPWATHPLPDCFFPLPSFAITEAGEIRLTEGTSFADIIGLPTPWPPPG